ncbi:beta-ketoacyl synthase N-terminal-like domain-containing protein [Sorangium sp. So ce118]
MQNCKPPELVISGIGVTASIGQGKEAFRSALFEGRHSFGVMARPGRQRGRAYIGAELPELSIPPSISRRNLRTASHTGQAAVVTLHEAWQDADLAGVPPERVGLIVGGSNMQQRELLQTYESYRDRPEYIRPNHAVTYMDSDVCGFCTEQFGIKGLAYTIGGASASGLLAVIQAIHAVRSAQVDVCIALGALADLSFLELQAFRSLGAMGSDRYADDPSRACRPFDASRDGFIYGESCGAVVIERAESARQRERVTPYARASGWAVAMDGNRNPNPSYEGEVRVIQGALREANLSARDIDYVNPHGTGSVIGDETELRVLYDCDLAHAPINATKSIIGHGLSAAGTVEIIAVLLQMQGSRLHPTRNLDEPIDPRFRWVRHEPVAHEIGHALKMSMGFGGINAAVVLSQHNSR